MRIAAARTSALLSLMFVVVYGTCNWITAQRTDVGTWYFEWERLIPFVPLMIVPYWSLDLFFLAGPFVCRTREERRTLSRRILFAIVAAGACFLVIPLRFGFDRPPTSGWTGRMFDLLYGFDRPYNLFPSLHITLRTILASLYARHSRGLLRHGVHGWFVLIGISTLLTYQHHVIDLVGGFALAAFCFYLFREESLHSPGMRNRRVGGRYLAGAVLAASIVPVSWPATAWLCWPAIALGFVATAYFGLGPRVYRKSDGLLPLSARCVLAPCLLGQRASLWWYRRAGARVVRLAPGLWIGPLPGRLESEEIRRQGVTAVLDLTAEFTEPRALREPQYLNLPILDLTAPTLSQLQDAVAFITRHAPHGIVYVHCKVGYSRTAAAVAAYLIASGQAAGVPQSLEMLRRASPGIIVRPEILEALGDYVRFIDRDAIGHR